jgi:hypothetical protein
MYDPPYDQESEEHDSDQTLEQMAQAARRRRQVRSRD